MHSRTFFGELRVVRGCENKSGGKRGEDSRIFSNV